MGELLNRDVQYQILRNLAEVYPREMHGAQVLPDEPDNTANVNLTYLHEHGLITCTFYPTLGDPYPLPHAAKITKDGLDFLSDDGGLSAILGVVTIRFDDLTLKALLVERIEKENGDQGLKAQMIAAVKAMPAEALKAVGEKAIAAGIAGAPAGLHALRIYLGIG